MLLRRLASCRLLQILRVLAGISWHLAPVRLDLQVDSVSIPLHTPN